MEKACHWCRASRFLAKAHSSCPPCFLTTDTTEQPPHALVAVPSSWGPQSTLSMKMLLVRQQEKELIPHALHWSTPGQEPSLTQPLVLSPTPLTVDAEKFSKHKLASEGGSSSRNL